MIFLFLLVVRHWGFVIAASWIDCYCSFLNKAIIDFWGFFVLSDSIGGSAVCV